MEQTAIETCRGWFDSRAGELQTHGIELECQGETRAQNEKPGAVVNSNPNAGFEMTVSHLRPSDSSPRSHAPMFDPLSGADFQGARALRASRIPFARLRLAPLGYRF
jgi:hypothetical protein